MSGLGVSEPLSGKQSDIKAARQMPEAVYVNTSGLSGQSRAAKHRPGPAETMHS